MQGKIRIAVVFTMTAALVLGAVGAYVIAGSGHAQGGPEPRTITPRIVPTASEGASVGIAASEGFVYVLDSGKVYKLDADSLEVVKKGTYKTTTAAAPVRRITQPGGDDSE